MNTQKQTEGAKILTAIDFIRPHIVRTLEKHSAGEPQGEELFKAVMALDESELSAIGNGLIALQDSAAILLSAIALLSVAKHVKRDPSLS